MSAPGSALRSSLRLLAINLKLLFGRLWWIFLLAEALWFILYLVRAYMGWSNEPWEPADVQGWLLLAPLQVFAIVLGMNSIAQEIDERTIEGLLTVSGPRYRPWIVRIATAALFLLIADLLLATLGWLFLVDFPFIPVVLNAYLPALLYYALTLMFSLLFKGSLPAGIAVAPLLAFNLTILSGITRNSRYDVFFNYLRRPNDIDDVEWMIMAVQNRLGLVLLTGLILFYTVRLTDQRERLL